MALNCSDVDPSLASLCECNNTVHVLEAALAAADSAAESVCASASSIDAFNLPLHIGAIFIIIVCSFIGVALPLLGKLMPRCGIPPFAIALGKTAGTGIVLSCALVHMLLPATESLTSECLPAAFSVEYAAYSYLFCLLSALVMHGTELTVASRGSALDSSTAAAATQLSDGGDAALSAIVPASTAVESPAADAAGDDDSAAMTAKRPAAPAPDAADSSLTSPPSVGVNVDAVATIKASSAPPPTCAHAHDATGSAAALQSAERLVAAISMEFAMSFHSILIGITVGLSTDAEFPALLTALCFHQFFEGVAVGARLVDAPMSSAADIAFAVIFALSAPVGMAVGTGLVGSGGIDTNSEAFTLATGVLESVCAGILLYFGFSLLLADFPADLKRFAPHSAIKRAAFFAALWLGVGLMSFIGRWL